MSGKSIFIPLVMLATCLMPLRLLRGTKLYTERRIIVCPGCQILSYIQCAFLFDFVAATEDRVCPEIYVDFFCKN